MKELSRGSNMKSVFLITISDHKRIKESTRVFLSEVGMLFKTREVGVDLLSENWKDLGTAYNLSLANFVTGGKLSLGELGCLLSHQLVYKTIVDEGIDWAIVIEDDAEILTDTNTLIKMSDQWFRNGHEFVHLAPYLGGVLVAEGDDQSGVAIVPPLGAYAYWISAKGAFKLQTQNEVIGGLADWPIQISNVKTRSVFVPVFYSGLENSLIENMQTASAPSRISLAYRPLAEIFTLSNAAILINAISVYGFRAVGNFIFGYRTYKRLGRLLGHASKGQNNTHFFLSRK